MRNLLLLFACLALAAPRARAEVVGVEIVSRTPVLDSRPWGSAGAYERLVGRIEFALDPANPFNDRIVDLLRAPRGADGRVHASADLVVLQPTQAGRRSGTALRIASAPAPFTADQGVTATSASSSFGRFVQRREQLHCSGGQNDFLALFHSNRGLSFTE